MKNLLILLQIVMAVLGMGLYLFNGNIDNVILAILNIVVAIYLEVND